MSKSMISGEGWTPDKSKGPLPKDWTWSFTGPDPWGVPETKQGDPAGLTAWMQAMAAWGQLVSIKCRDLEERVRYLEQQAGNGPAKGESQ